MTPCQRNWLVTATADVTSTSQLEYNTAVDDDSVDQFAAGLSAWREALRRDRARLGQDEADDVATAGLFPDDPGSDDSGGVDEHDADGGA
jgi:hypothetical protein